MKRRVINESIYNEVVLIDTTALYVLDDSISVEHELKPAIIELGGLVGQKEYVDEDGNDILAMTVKNVAKEDIIDVINDLYDITNGYSYLIEDDFVASKLPNKMTRSGYGIGDRFERNKTSVRAMRSRFMHESTKRDYPSFDEVKLNESATKRKDYPSYDEVEINEKKKPCCPKKKAINEKLKAMDAKYQAKVDKIEKDIVDNVLDDILHKTAGEKECIEAFEKLKKYQSTLNKIAKDEEGNKLSVKDVNNVTKALKKIQTIVPEKQAKEVKSFTDKLSTKVSECIKAGKTSLHESAKINGKSVADYDVFELRTIENKIKNQKGKLVNVMESMQKDTDEYKKLSENLRIKNRILDVIDEELTYRVILKKATLFEGLALNETDDGVITDDQLQDLFGPAQGDENNKSEKTEEETSDNTAEETSKEETSDDTEDEDNVVELARIEITLKDKASAETLKGHCIDAGIDEEALEIEAVEEATEEESEEETEETEETVEDDTTAEEAETEETEETEEKETPNESVTYRNLATLFEDEDSEETEETETEETEDTTEEETEEETEETEDSGNYKLILVNTDFANILAKVLADKYGITTAEFEDMIGGEIVETSEETNDKDSKDETSEETKETEETEDSKDEDDDVDTKDLFKGL